MDQHLIKCTHYDTFTPFTRLHHPSTAVNPPRFVPEPLSSSFLDPDYAPSAELLGGDEEHSSTRASKVDDIHNQKRSRDGL